MNHTACQGKSFVVTDSLSRRQWLLATAGLGGVLTVAAIVPLVASLLPSERAKAAGAPVEVDIGTLAPGEMMVVEWRGKPVWVLHRTPEMLASLAKAEPMLVDPDSNVAQQPNYAHNQQRSLKPEYLVAVGICTHLAVRQARLSRLATRRWVRTGPAASSAPATDRPSISPAASSRTNLRRPTWRFHHTITSPTAAC